MTDGTTTAEGGLEGALTELSTEAAALVRALAAAARAAKKAASVAETGTVRDIPIALANAATAARHAAETADRVREAWHFDVEGWFASGEYTKELLALAAETGVGAFESDDRILCYPVIVQVATGDASVVIDKKKERGVRPSAIVARLRAMQQREPKFKPEAFIESLASAYDLVIASKQMRPGAAARLVDVHAVLTLMPGSAREYTKQEFARDIYLLDQKGLVTTKNGRRMGLPASALTRSAGVMRTVTRTGQSKDYAGISFEESRS
jgi:hypothetical protein